MNDHTIACTSIAEVAGVIAIEIVEVPHNSAELIRNARIRVILTREEPLCVLSPCPIKFLHLEPFPMISPLFKPRDFYAIKLHENDLSTVLLSYISA